MERTLQPEWLDLLPSEDPRAAGSRRDLRRINACMGNARLIATALAESARLAPPRRILDLGAGDGILLLAWLRRMPALPAGTAVLLVDRHDAAGPRVMTELRRAGFRPQRVKADALEWLGAQPAEPGTWVLANLFLHHLGAESLRTLFRQVSEHTDLCCACEPHRAWWALAASRLLRLLGANDVTRHDAVISVRAGFRSGELSALWPAGARWRLRDHRAGLFSQIFLARRV